jgi:hypothetical protein
MKKVFIFLLIVCSFIFISCPKDNTCTEGFYNYDGKPVYIKVNVENKTQESVLIDFSSYSFSDLYELQKLPEIDSDNKDNQQTVEKNSERTFTYVLMNNKVLWQLPIKSSSHHVHYQSIVGSVKYSDGSEKKITGYDLNKTEIASLQNDDFTLSGFGYYIVDTSVEVVDSCFGVFKSPDENVNGIKEGTISLIVRIEDSKIECLYN